MFVKTILTSVWVRYCNFSCYEQLTMLETAFYFILLERGCKLCPQGKSRHYSVFLEAIFPVWNFSKSSFDLVARPFPYPASFILKDIQSLHYSLFLEAIFPSIPEVVQVVTLLNLSLESLTCDCDRPVLLLEHFALVTNSAQYCHIVTLSHWLSHIVAYYYILWFIVILLHIVTHCRNCKISVFRAFP